MICGFEFYQEIKGEEYMSECMCVYFIVILNKWKQELMEEVDCIVYYMQDEVVNFFDLVDCVSQEEEFSLELCVCDCECKLIKKIDEIL